MNATELQNLRVALAQQLRAALPHPLPAAALVRGARLVGFRDLTEPEAVTELRYLVDKGLVGTVPQEISPELKRYTLTAAGRDWLALEGL